MANKYAKIKEWFEDGYIPKFDFVFFNVSSYEVGNASINSIQGERVLNEFMDGSREVELLFSISLMKGYDAAGTSDVNLEAIQDFENIAMWVEEQNENKNYPDFGNNVLIEDLSVLSSAPTVMVDNQNQIAKYQGQFKIRYMEEI